MTYTRNSPLIQLCEVVPQPMYQIVGYGLSGTLYKKLVTKPTSCAREDPRGLRGCLSPRFCHDQTSRPAGRNENEEEARDVCAQVLHVDFRRPALHRRCVVNETETLVCGGLFEPSRCPTSQRPLSLLWKDRANYLFTSHIYTCPLIVVASSVPRRS